jgi:hypothetical protein
VDGVEEPAPEGDDDAESDPPEDPFEEAPSADDVAVPAEDDPFESVL